MELDFYKANGRWYVDLPTWEGAIDDLEMVNGADDLLEALAEVTGSEQVKMEVWLEEPDEPCSILWKIDQDAEGATYEVQDCQYYTGDAWLCNVTRFVFDGYHPDRIFFRHVQE